MRWRPHKNKKCPTGVSVYLTRPQVAQLTSALARRGCLPGSWKQVITSCERSGFLACVIVYGLLVSVTSQLAALAVGRAASGIRAALAASVFVCRSCVAPPALIASLLAVAVCPLGSPLTRRRFRLVSRRCLVRCVPLAWHALVFAAFPDLLGSLALGLSSRFLASL